MIFVPHTRGPKWSPYAETRLAPLCPAHTRAEDLALRRLRSARGLSGRLPPSVATTRKEWPRGRWCPTRAARGRPSSTDVRRKRRRNSGDAPPVHPRVRGRARRRGLGDSGKGTDRKPLSRPRRGQKSHLRWPRNSRRFGTSITASMRRECALAADRARAGHMDEGLLSVHFSTEMALRLFRDAWRGGHRQASPIIGRRDRNVLSTAAGVARRRRQGATSLHGVIGGRAAGKRRGPRIEALA